MIDFRDLLNGLRDETAVPTRGLEAIGARAGQIRRRRLARWAGGGVAVIAAVAVVTALVMSGSRSTQVTAGPPATPAPAPAGGLSRVAVATATGIDIIEGQHHIHVAAPGASGLAWSADGTMLAYLQGQPAQLWITTPDGRTHEVTAPVVAFAWAPTGNHLAIWGGGGGLVIATPTTGQFTLLVGQDFFVSSVAWSPDGRSVAYAQSFPPQSAGPAERTDRVYVRTLGTSVAPTLAYTAPSGDGVLLGAWWPNGRGLYLWPDTQHSSSIAADGLDLLGVPLGGGATIDLGVTLPTPRSLAFSPHGSQVVVMTGASRFINGNKSLERCPVGSVACTPVSQPPGTVSVAPSWSPDGRSIVFVRGNASVNPDPAQWLSTTALYVEDLTSGTVRQIGGSLRGVGDPEFSADGRLVLFQHGTAMWILDLTTGATTQLADGLAPLVTQWMGLEAGGTGPDYAWYRSR